MVVVWWCGVRVVCGSVVSCDVCGGGVLRYVVLWWQCTGSGVGKD